MPWDAPNRLLAWAYLPLPWKDWAVTALADMRTGFAFSARAETGVIAGAFDSYRYPMNFDLNLAIERMVTLHGYRFALRGGVDNLTGRANYTSVNNVTGTPQFPQFLGPEGRHLSCASGSSAAPEENSRYEIPGRLLFAGAAWGQHYEIGATVGYGIYNNGTIFSDTQTVQAGIRNRFAAGINIGEDVSDYVSGEFQYLYHDGHPFLQGAGVKTDIQGQSGALTMNALFYFKKRSHRWRPFVEGGAAAKSTSSPGRRRSPQPIPQVASLTTNDVWKVVFVAGRRRETPAHSAPAAAGEVSRLHDHLPPPADCTAPQHSARRLPAVHAPVRSKLHVLMRLIEERRQESGSQNDRSVAPRRPEASHSVFLDF